MSYPGPIQWYHFQADLIWPDRIPLKMPEEVYVNIYTFIFTWGIFLRKGKDRQILYKLSIFFFQTFNF
jgi:hypothetical protein